MAEDKKEQNVNAEKSQVLFQKWKVLLIKIKKYYHGY